MHVTPLDPLAAIAHAHIEQLRREADADRLTMHARAGRGAYGWPAWIATALRDSVATAFNRPARATGTSRSIAACCV